jgi:hypothetical protein
MAKKAAEEEKSVEIHVPLNVVKIMHEHFKADLLLVHGSLDSKISDLQQSQKKLLLSTESLNKTAENLHSTTMSYRDALMAKPANSLKLIVMLTRKCSMT